MTETGGAAAPIPQLAVQSCHTAQLPTAQSTGHISPPPHPARAPNVSFPGACRRRSPRAIDGFDGSPSEIVSTKDTNRQVSFSIGHSPFGIRRWHAPRCPWGKRYPRSAESDTIGHAAPVPLGCAVTDRVLQRVPPPQLCEHEPHDCHGVTAQSSGHTKTLQPPISSVAGHALPELTCVQYDVCEG